MPWNFIQTLMVPRGKISTSWLYAFRTCLAFIKWATQHFGLCFNLSQPYPDNLITKQLACNAKQRCREPEAMLSNHWKFDILGNALILLLAQSWMRRSIPLSCHPWNTARIALLSVNYQKTGGSSLLGSVWREQNSPKAHTLIPPWHSQLRLMLMALDFFCLFWSPGMLYSTVHWNSESLSALVGFMNRVLLTV